MDILIVDSDSSARDVLITILKKKYSKIDTARNLNEALPLVKKHKYGAVIIDIDTNQRLYFEIKKKFPTYEKNVLFISKGSTSRENQVFLSMMFGRWIIKPVNETSVNDLIRKFTNGEKK
jgi:DNA-binding NtrC family response regulator